MRAGQITKEENSYAAVKVALRSFSSLCSFGLAIFRCATMYSTDRHNHCEYDIDNVCGENDSEIDNT